MLKKNIKLILTAITLLLIITICLFLLSINKTTNKDINLSKTTTIKDNDNPTIRDIYHQFNPEEGILYNVIGSGNNKDYYAYYYKKNKTSFKNLDNTVKTYLTIHSIDYQSFPKDNNNECYKVSKNELQITYNKIFKNNDNFQLKFLDNDNPRIENFDDEICIHDNTTTDPQLALDTYFVNAILENNTITIYERVAFIKFTNSNAEFYSDYNMKNKVYSIEKKDIDTAFLNNMNIVSNILIKYQDKFKIYTYNFEKSKEHYTFKSIEL